jgi:hypothetical protein
MTLMAYLIYFVNSKDLTLFSLWIIDKFAREYFTGYSTKSHFSNHAPAFDIDSSRQVGYNKKIDKKA